MYCTLYSVQYNIIYTVPHVDTNYCALYQLACIYGQRACGGKLSKTNHEEGAPKCSPWATREETREETTRDQTRWSTQRASHEAILTSTFLLNPEKQAPPTPQLRLKVRKPLEIQIY